MITWSGYPDPRTGICVLEVHVRSVHGSGVRRRVPGDPGLGAAREARSAPTPYPPAASPAETRGRAYAGRAPVRDGDAPTAVA